MQTLNSQKNSDVSNNACNSMLAVKKGANVAAAYPV